MIEGAIWRRWVFFYIPLALFLIFLRAGDAVHLMTAVDAGFKEVWTNDRHMLAAASSFGLRGRSVPA